MKGNDSCAAQSLPNSLVREMERNQNDDMLQMYCLLFDLPLLKSVGRDKFYPARYASTFLFVCRMFRTITQSLWNATKHSPHLLTLPGVEA
jgi:hypothetical protein